MKMITHKIFWLVLLISLASITNKVSAQFVPMQSAQYKHLAADTLYDFTGNGAPTIHPNSYKRVVTYFDSTNGIPYWHNPKTQTWITISGGGGSGADTAKLISGWGTIISGENGFYAPNYPDATITVDSNDIKTFVNEYVSNDTTVFHFDSSDVTFYVDSIVLAPPPGAVSGDKFLIGSPATGTFAGKTNQIAELVGAVWNYTIPDATNIGDIIAVQNGVLSYYKYNGATWVFQRSFPSWGGDYLGLNGDIGVKSNNSLNLLTNGIRQFTIDPLGKLYANNLKHKDTSTNFLKVIDSTTGEIGTGNFKRLVAGTNITITSSASADTISSTGGGGGGTGIDSLLKSNKNTVSARKSSVFIPQYIMGDTAILYVKDFGLVGDSSTDNSSALTALLATIPTGKAARILFGNGIFKFNSSVTIDKQVIIEGIGKSVHPEMAVSANIPSGTKLFTASATIRLFDIRKTNVKFKDLTIQNVATTPTTGAGIYAYEGHGFGLDWCMVSGFYNNIQFVNGGEWSITHSQILGMVNAGVVVRDSARADDGDESISDCIFMAFGRNANYGIYQTSAGGLRISNNKFNHDGFDFKMGYQYYSIFSEPTIDLVITGNSFENYTTGAIYVNPQGGTFFPGSIAISGNQFASYAAGALTDVTILGNTQAVTIMGNSFRGNSSATAISITSSTNPAISNSYFGYVTPTVYSSSNNTIVDNSAITAANRVLVTGSATTGAIKQLGAGTSGQFLKSQGSGTDPVFADLPVGNLSLPAGQIARGTGSAVYSDANLYFDTTNRYLGINTSSPAATLDIKSSFIGTVAVTSGSPTVTGTGTQFLTSVHVGDNITINSETRIVSTITSNTVLTTTTNFTSSASGVTYVDATDANPFKFYSNGDIKTTTSGGATSLWYWNSNGVNYSNLFIAASPATTIANAGWNNIGIAGLGANTSGRNNITVGGLASNTSGWYNCAFGAAALNANTTNFSSSAFGHSALQVANAGNNNAFGYLSLGLITTGANNLAMGERSGYFLADGVSGNIASNRSIYFGNNTKTAAASSTNEIVIGDTTTGGGTNSITIGNKLHTNTSIRGKINVAAFADLTAQTATVASVATYTTGAADSTFDIAGRLTVTSVTGGTVKLSVTYTDESNTSRTVDFYSMGTTTAALSATGVSSFPVLQIRCKASTSITVSTTATATITYNVGATITKIR